MSGLVKAQGNMYGWVTHMHTHLRGGCSHLCCYCYASRPSRGHPSSQDGALRLAPIELSVRYGSGKTIFVEHLNDLFADGVADVWIGKILAHCSAWPRNEYVLQTKNPERMGTFMPVMPCRVAIGVTLETNRYVPLAFSAAPQPRERAQAFAAIGDAAHIRRFVTCEPIMDCDPDVLAEMVKSCRPDWVNVGADSKGHHLPEPSAADLCELIRRLRGYGLEVRLKTNLRRLLPQLTDVEWEYWVGGAA
jgi:DNA repair photolyase